MITSSSVFSDCNIARLSLVPPKSALLVLLNVNVNQCPCCCFCSRCIRQHCSPDSGNTTFLHYPYGCHRTSICLCHSSASPGPTAGENRRSSWWTKMTRRNSKRRFCSPRPSAGVLPPTLLLCASWRLLRPVALLRLLSLSPLVMVSVCTGKIVRSAPILPDVSSPLLPLLQPDSGCLVPTLLLSFSLHRYAFSTLLTLLSSLLRLFSSWLPPHRLDAALPPGPAKCVDWPGPAPKLGIASRGFGRSGISHRIGRGAEAP